MKQRTCIGHGRFCCRIVTDRLRFGYHRCVTQRLFDMIPDVVNFELVKRVLVIKLRHHGDVLLTTPVINALRAAAAHIEIDALVYSDTAAMLQGHPALAHIHGVDREWRRRGLATQLRAEWRLFRALDARSYDLIVHLTEAGRGAWLSRALRPRYAVARKRAAFGWTKSFTHLYSLPTHALRHTVEKDLDALRRIGLQPAPTARHLTMVPSQEALERVAALFAAAGLAAPIHVHPTSRWMFKSWPADRMAQLLTALAQRGESIVLTAAPSANERALVARVLELVPAACRNRIHDLSGQLSLPELAAVSRAAKLFIGVDSAPMHIAASQGTPIVALFGPSGEAEWGPWLVAHRIVTTDHPCRPCGQDGCGGGKLSECLTALPVDRVLTAVDAFLTQALPTPARWYPPYMLTQA
jgi:heptosyltransferase III